MLSKIKDFFSILIILILISILGTICFRYYKLKSEGKIEQLLKNSETSSVKPNIDEMSQSFSDARSNGEYKDESATNSIIEDFNNIIENKKENSNSETDKFVVEKKNYDNYYNEFNFDNRLLLYEGKQSSSNTKAAINILIDNIDDSLYSKPIIAFENFDALSSNEITPENLEEYRNVLKQAKNSLENNTYNFSFEYNKFNTMINKIIISKNK